MQQHFFDQQQLQRQWWQQQQYLQHQSLQAFTQQQQLQQQRYTQPQQEPQPQQHENVLGSSGIRIQPPGMFSAATPPPLDAPPPLLTPATAAGWPLKTYAQPSSSPATSSPGASAPPSSGCPPGWHTTTGMPLADGHAAAATTAPPAAATATASTAVAAAAAAASSMRWEARQCVGSFNVGSLECGSSLGFSPTSSYDPCDATSTWGQAATVSLSGASNGSSFADAPLLQPCEEASSGPLDWLQPVAVSPGKFNGECNYEANFCSVSGAKDQKDQSMEQEQKHHQMREQPQPLLQKLC